MRKSFWFALVLAAASATAAQGASIACGEVYVAKAGDTVAKVAAKAFGPGLHRQLFVNTMMHRHGGNGGALAEGAIVAIPCASGTGLDVPADYWSASTYESAEITVQVAGYDPATVASVKNTGSLLAALLDEAMREGLLTPTYEQLPSANVATQRPFRDGKGAQDVSFPWRRTDCAEARGASQPLCKGALWSDPFFEITSGAYMREDAFAGGLAGVKGRRVCIADESRAAVAQSGLVSDQILNRALGGQAPRCLALLWLGDVAAVIVPDIAAAAESRKNPTAPRLKKLQDAVFSDMFHAIVDRRNPNADRILKRMNEGLAKIRDSGAWYEIVRTELTAALIN